MAQQLGLRAVEGDRPSRRPNDAAQTGILTKINSGKLQNYEHRHLRRLPRRTPGTTRLALRGGLPISLIVTEAYRSNFVAALLAEAENHAPRGRESGECR